MITKSLFRRTTLHYRQLMDQQRYAERNKELLKSTFDFLCEKNLKCIHTFLPIQKNNEPDITTLFENFWSLGLQLIVTQTDFTHQQLNHFYLQKETKLKENARGIPEPINAEPASLEDLDVVLVPLLVVDRQGYRIGYGGGYYDRLLKETKACKVGLSLSPPVDNILQREEWDIPLDYLITPFKTYKYG